MPNDAEPIDFREMLSRPIGEWEGTTLLPSCHMFGEVVDVLEGRSMTKQTPRFAFICSPREFGPDVTDEMKAEMAAVNLSDYEFPNRNYLDGSPAGVIYITPKAMVMNREFFENMGFPPTKPMDQCIMEMKGKKVLMGIGRDKNPKTDRYFNQMVSLQRDPR